ncbi:MAG: S-methyl-5'-thioadenosine phosphorylase [Peptococcaceae bacterium]|jgi:5'-methylthioadenosine phosphorylase|nr:S-methyl-5'-thioadenosine phosphorylase [Peptococcaceae bacterium]
MDYALIGGTGVEKLCLADPRSISVNTPYGEVNLETAKIEDVEIAFLRRHGKKHNVPPHLINYRANIWALKEIGVKKIIASGAVGSLTSEFEPGDLVLVEQFLDFTKNRPLTFFDGSDQGVLHVDVTDPYCPDLRNKITTAAKQCELSIKAGGVYVCTEGPRFETPAEINMFRILGGHLVGMTGVPEVVLARELGICYATIALVTNLAAGISKQPLTHAEVIATMNMINEKFATLFKTTCKLLDDKQNCYCASGSKEVGLF